MWYYHRYESHKNALKIARQQKYDLSKKKQILLEDFMCRYQDLEFLDSLIDTIIHSRNVLQCSYIMGYYLKTEPQDQSQSLKKKSNSKVKAPPSTTTRVETQGLMNLFEYLQEDMEKYVNHLSELFETKTTGKKYDDFIKWKDESQQYAALSKRFTQNFLDGLHNGLTSYE